MKAIDFNFSRKEWEEYIYQWIFDEESRKMVIYSLLDGYTYDQIASEMSLSVDTVSKKTRKAKKYLLKHLKI